MVAGLFGRDAASGVVDEQHLQQLQAVLVEVGAQDGSLVAFPLREGRLEVRVRGDTRPNLLRGGTQ